MVASVCSYLALYFFVKKREPMETIAAEVRDSIFSFWLFFLSSSSDAVFFAFQLFFFSAG